MQQFKFLETLVGFEPAGFPFLSVYLNTEPNETGKKDFEVFLRKQFSEYGAVYEEASSEKQSFEADEKRINEFLEGVDPSVRGIAIFACTGADGFFQRFEFEVPFEENAFHVSEKPVLYPLIKLFAQNPAFAVVAADTNHADIYLFRRGKTLNVAEIENVKTNRSEVGGWSQMRYQRHIDNFHQAHARETMQEVEKLVRDAGIEQVILCGDESVIVPMLKGEVSKELEDKVVGSISLNVDTPEHEIYEKALELLQENEVKADKEKIDHLLENNYEDGLGVVGLEKTLEALMNGQVQELYLASDVNQINYDRATVRSILRSYEPGVDTELPDASERQELIDEVVRQAAQSADKIRFIRDPELLHAHGGIGALLRYQIKGATTA